MATKKNVYLIPGFLTSRMGMLSVGNILWWNVDQLSTFGIDPLRLAADGTSPGQPGGTVMGVEATPPPPWDAVQAQLVNQLDPDLWKVRTGPYDWRLNVLAAAADLAGVIIGQDSPEVPCTIVGHSMGGLVAMMAWKILNTSGFSANVRRIITLGTPFQGSYYTISWLSGANLSIQQQLGLALLSGFPIRLHPPDFSLENLNSIALTWPGFYQLYPALIGSDSGDDPNRQFLYNATNYPANATPAQAWLDYARNQWQADIQGAGATPPTWVATYVFGSGIQTPNSLGSNIAPLQLNLLGSTMNGDGVVTTLSAVRSEGYTVEVSAEHNSMPLALAQSGDLVKLILDPRGPPDPTPPPLVIGTAFSENVTAPPELDYVSTLQCLQGG
jgi:pimeloyl-ACP methyl ester carboxylesterase